MPQNQQTNPSQPGALPDYQPPAAPLNPNAQRALASLLQSNALRHLKTNINDASEALTTVAGDVNERLADCRAKHQKAIQKRRARGEEVDDNETESEEAQKVARLEKMVNEVTSQLDEKIRDLIDAEVNVEGLADVVDDLGKEAQEQHRRNSERSTGQRKRRRGNDDGDEYEEENQVYEESSEPEENEPPVAPSKRLEERLAQKREQWENNTLTERYAKNNTYVGFYRMVHEAKQPGSDVPPLPHASTWFAHLENEAGDSSTPNTRTRGRGRRNRQPSADDDEIAIARERISLKCPLTLLPFQDPVTSTKCPHSFERAAIQDMIAKSTLFIPADGEPAIEIQNARRRPANATKAIRCPVCTVDLTLQDLKSDPVLLRRVRRMQEEEQARAAADEDDLNSSRRRKSGFTIADDEENEDDGWERGLIEGNSTVRQTVRRTVRDDRRRIKVERAATRSRDPSMIPNTQLQRNSDRGSNEAEEEEDAAAPVCRQS